MSDLPPIVELSAVIIGRKGHVFLTYNSRWHGFALPMSKLHELPPLTPATTSKKEEPLDAAIRSTVEALGRPLLPDEFPRQSLAELPEYLQSQRDGLWKRLKVHVFELNWSRLSYPNPKFTAAIEYPDPLPGNAGCWITLQDLGRMKPITPTTLFILGGVAEADLAQITA